MKLLRIILLPFSIIYGSAVSVRNWLYDTGFLKSRQFGIPLILVGNLDIGGAGKTPMTEYLVNLLKSSYRLATLSRGYGRKTRGFIIATENDKATIVGDEPAQFKQKFKDITVAVCEKRADGIAQLQPDHEVIILDDAYQHRAVKTGLSILLFDYSRLPDNKWVLPSGNLREPFVGRWRADILIVTKSPVGVNLQQQAKAIELLHPFAYQQVFFTSIEYKELTDLDGNKVTHLLDNDTQVFLLTGIANAQPLINKVKEYTSAITHHSYPDHHLYTLKNISKLAADFFACKATKKLIITTEKDAQRLVEENLVQHIKKLPVLVWPIGVKFEADGETQFNQLIFDYVRKYSTNNSIH